MWTLHLYTHGHTSLLYMWIHFTSTHVYTSPLHTWTHFTSTHVDTLHLYTCGHTSTHLNTLHLYTHFYTRGHFTYTHVHVNYVNHFTVQVVHRGALHRSTRGDWALQLVQEMLGYQLEHLLVCTCGCAIPVMGNDCSITATYMCSNCTCGAAF